jgi:hypothetical protein
MQPAKLAVLERSGTVAYADAVSNSTKRRVGLS